MRRLCTAALIGLLLSPCAKVWAHGVVGDYTFIEPIVADDANPKNEFDILRPQETWTRDGREFGLGFSFEKTIVPAPESYSNGRGGGGLVSIEVGSEWIDQSPRQGPNVSGFNELEVMPKWAFLTIPSREFRLSIGAKFLLPTGNPSVQDQNHTQFGPEFLWANGFGQDFPKFGWAKFLRPFAIQGDFGYLPALGGSTYHEMFADNVIEYSLPYLSNDVHDIGLKWPIRNMYPYVEFNYDQLITGPSGETFPQILVTPGLAFMGRYCELSVATQLALNSATVPNNHAAVIGLLDLFIDDIVPATNWTPFQ